MSLHASLALGEKQARSVKVLRRPTAAVSTSMPGESTRAEGPLPAKPSAHAILLQGTHAQHSSSCT